MLGTAVRDTAACMRLRAVDSRQGSSHSLLLRAGDMNNSYLINSSLINSYLAFGRTRLALRLQQATGVP